MQVCGVNSTEHVKCELQYAMVGGNEVATVLSF